MREGKRRGGEARVKRREVGEPFCLPLQGHDLDIEQVLANYSPWAKFSQWLSFVKPIN